MIMLAFVAATNLIDDRYHACWRGAEMENFLCGGYLMYWTLTTALSGFELLVWLTGRSGSDIMVFGHYHVYQKGLFYLSLAVPMWLWVCGMVGGETQNVNFWWEFIVFNALTSSTLIIHLGLP